MRRRALLVGIGVAAVARHPARADTLKVVGILAPGPLRPIVGFKQRLSDLGWAEGRKVQFEERWAWGDDGRYVPLAAELAALPVDTVVTWSTPAALAAKKATGKIPIVMATIADPIVVGVVAGLSHPEGNITGFSSQNFDLEEKRFELLREIAPALRHIAMLGNAGNPYSMVAVKRVSELASAAGLRFDEINVDLEGGLAAGLEKLRKANPGGALVAAAPALFPYHHPIAEFMAASRIPAVYPYREFAESGGLLVYATNFEDLFRQAAGYVDKVLRGTPPGELPVQQATMFELVLNIRAAKAIGLSIPQSLFARADEVIE